MSKIEKLDWDIIDARVRKTKERLRFPTLSLGFLAIVLEQLFPTIERLLPEVITEGADDKGVDAIHIVESDETADVYLIQSKYRDKYASCGRTINDPEILKMQNFLTDVFNQIESAAVTRNFRLREKMRHIWRLHQDGKMCRYKVVFCSNGQGFSGAAAELVSDFRKVYDNVSFEFYGGVDVLRGFATQHRAPENGVLHVIGREIFERSDGDIKGVIASVDALSFIDLICTADGQSIKRHLFDENLRIFLGAKGGYNSAIISTATADDSYLFWYLNNGITITCKKVIYNKAHTNPVLRFEDFQIVNGAQTSHSLFEARKASPAALENVVLMIRVYATERDDVAARVAVATNSQARIQPRDLKANHSVLRKLELGFLQKGYFFERKRNMAADKPEDKRIDALKLGQILLSYELGEPDRARRESDTIFDERFDQLFHGQHDIDHLIRLFEIYRIIERRREDYGSRQRPMRGDPAGLNYLVYGHWFVLYACRQLLLRSGAQTLPEGRDAEKLIDEATQIVAVADKNSGGLAHYQMFRNPRTREAIRAEIFGRQSSFFDLDWRV